MLNKKNALFLVMNILFAVFTVSPQSMEHDRIMEAREKALEWMYGQIVPNSSITRPPLHKENLVASYKVPRSDPAYRITFSRSGIYDNALAVIAFTMSGDFDKAEAVLAAMKKQQHKDGSFWFTVNTHNLWPSETFYDGAIKRSGAAAWAGYSAVYYIMKRKLTDRTYTESNHASSEIISMAEKTADYLLDNQILIRNDKRYGLIAGGSGNINITYDEKTNTQSESYDSMVIKWASMEHNIDSYFFLRDLGRLTGHSRYTTASELIKAGLMVLWSEKDNQFYQGISSEQVIDMTLPLDGASWGALFLLAVNENKKAEAALAAVEKKFKTQSDGYSGYGPYTGSYMHVDWAKLQLVWGEGTLGAAAAYIRSGNREKALAIIDEIIKMEENGGILYASAQVPNQFSRYPGVAGTAWLIIAAQLLIDENEIFWGK